MRTLHIAPGDSAGGSLRQAIQIAGRDDEVLAFCDDLSCGPIASHDPSARAAWWTQFYDWPEVEDAVRSFWAKVDEREDRLVIWFARHSARELAFSLAFADRLREHPYHVVDVTGRRLPYTRPDGSAALSQPAPAVSVVPSDALTTLLGGERPVTAQECAANRQAWERLKSENAPFRVVTPAGLVSAPIDHFDPLILELATPEWQKVARIVGGTLAYAREPYLQVGDLMLLTRVVALVEEGKLLADGDPWEMRSCHVRLPGQDAPPLGG
jgi:hypothetical protein